MTAGTNSSRRKGSVKLLAMVLVGLSHFLGISARSETLEAAWAVAEKANAGQEAIRSDTASASAQLRAAQALRLPMVDLTADYVHVGDPPTTIIALPVFGASLPISGDQDMAIGGISASYAIFTSGQVSNNIAAARIGSAAASMLERAGERDLRLTVAKAYFDVLRSQRALSVFGDSIRSLTTHVRDLHNFAAQGLIPRTDVLAAELLIADVQQQQIQAGTRDTLARASYNHLLGRALDAVVTLDERLTKLDLESTPLLASLLTSGESREEIRALQSKADALRYRAKGARAQVLPVVLIGGGYVRVDSDSRPSQGSWFAGATIKWRLFDGGKAEAEADRYRMDARSADNRAVEARNFVGLDVRRAWLSVRDARDRLVVAQAAIASADENLRVSRDRFRQGVGTNSAVLDAERDRSTAQLRFHTARYDGAYAEIDLQRAAGLL